MKWPARRATLWLRVGRDKVHAEARRREVVIWAGEAEYASLEDLTDTIARLAAEPAERCRRLVVGLERPLVQTRTIIDLPRVKDRELVALVAHQAARYFRRNGHPLVTDAVWVANGKARVAHAAAAPEPVVEAIVAGARAAGLGIASIALVDSPDALLLLPKSEHAARSRAQRTQLRRLASATIALWLIVLGLFGGRLLWERRAADRELTTLAAPLAAVLSARRELREAEATLQAIARTERVRGSSLELLVALVRALPDSAVLTSITWNVEDASMVTGYARRAGEVLARLERSSALGAARFDGPVVKETIAGRDWERFTIVGGEQVAPSRERSGP